MTIFPSVGFMKGLRLRTKVLIPVAVMILVVIVVALVVVNQVVRRQVIASVAHDLARSQRIFYELQKAERELLAERSWMISETPQLKAAVDTGDSTTVQRVANELFGTLGSDLLLVVDHAGRLLARNGGSASFATGIEFVSLFPGSQDFEEDSRLVARDHRSLRLLSVPILTTDQIAGVVSIGRVGVGRVLDLDYLAWLKNLVECEVVLVAGKGIRCTTLDPARQAEAPALFDNSAANNDSIRASFTVVLGGEEYLATPAGLLQEYILLKSVDQAFALIMHPIQRTMVWVGGFALIAALLISSFISFGIVSPVEKLAAATEQLSAGDYELPVQASSNDEIGQLATKFEDMRKALRHKMTEINVRNAELEEALSKLKMAQEEVVRTERLAATGKITAQLSHELNNPIHNIQSCLEAARKKLDAGHTSREFLDLAHDEVLRLGKLTRQMLDFYRPYSGDKKPIQVNKIIRDVHKTAASGARDARVEVALELKRSVGRAGAAKDQLKQVFLNLYLNALDAMPKGGTLVVSTWSSDSHVCVSFDDTGCGIPAENLGRIFDAFFTTKAEANGVGLGLSVSYGIVQSLGGTILVESEIEKGTRFVVQLPQAG